MSEDHYNTRQTLILRLKNQQDDRSWEEFVYFYERYINLIIYGLGVNQSHADDLTQTVLLNLWKKLPDFQYEPKQCKFRTWMNKVVRNTVFNHFRTSARYKKRLENAASEVEFESSMPDIYEIAEENWQDHISNLAWENIKGALSERDCQLFLMLAEGKSVDEITKFFDMKRNTLYVIRKRIVEKLSREIRRLDEDLS